MATIKGYTDLEQSKKLAEFLPIESADGGWYGTTNQKAPNTNFWLGTKYSKNAVCPAWSLAALLGVLPKGTNISNPKPINALGYCCWNQYDEIYADNPIDACYEMILKLH